MQNIYTVIICVLNCKHLSKRFISNCFSPPPDIEMSEKRKSRRDMSPQRKGFVVHPRDSLIDPYRKVRYKHDWIIVNKSK